MSGVPQANHRARYGREVAAAFKLLQYPREMVARLLRVIYPEEGVRQAAAPWSRLSSGFYADDASGGTARGEGDDGFGGGVAREADIKLWHRGHGVSKRG